MRIRYYFIGLLFLSYFASIFEAESSTHNIDLVNQIKPNPTTRSKSTSIFFQSDLKPIKLAGVQFLTSEFNLKFEQGEVDDKAKCASLGYVIPASNCVDHMKPSHLCSSEVTLSGDTDYTTGCCNSNLYTVDSAEKCGNNSTALNDTCYWGGSKKYRCACDRSRYPYSSLTGEGCGGKGDFDINNYCTAPDASGTPINYYTSCCPSGYKDCSKQGDNLVGTGNSCRIKDSKDNIIHKYESCVCSSSYDTICPDAMLINSSDTCTDDKGKFTRDNNCESKCTQTVETNIDNYLYGKVWHCLYEQHGATIKDVEGAICRGINEEEKEDNGYYNKCESQGYIKKVDDCYIGDLILYCPSDNSKVWCLDGKYCTGYNVGNISSNNACTIGAKIDTCPDRSKGTRCRYTYSECNNCWNDGTYNPVGCSNLDTSEKGDSEKCCKKGYRMESGICKKNECNPIKYPYENLHPGADQGKLETCYEGNPDISSGVDVHYGYSECYSTNGGMWKRVSENQGDAGYYQCVCDKKNDERGWLPFTSDLYFDANSDTTENYIHVGFNKGAYGVQTSCTDSEGSYYGYSSCYIGSKKGENTSELAKGMCLSHGVTANTTTYVEYPATEAVRNQINNILTSVGVSAISTPTSPIVNGIPQTNKVYCINNTTHCKDGNGDDSACALIKNPVTDKICENGYEEECTYCYHTSNLVKEGGKFKAHKKFKLRIQTTNNAGAWYMGFEECPAGYESTWPTYGTCFKYCSVNDKSKCILGDVLQDANGNNLGIVYYNNGSTMYVAALDVKTGQTYEQALNYASTYAPTGTSDSNFTSGWIIPMAEHMTSTVLPQYAMYVAGGTYYKFKGSANIFENSWTQTLSGSSGAYIRNCCGSTTTVSLTKTYKAIPIKVITY